MNTSQAYYTELYVTQQKRFIQFVSGVQRTVQGGQLHHRGVRHHQVSILKNFFFIAPKLRTNTSGTTIEG